MPFLASYLHDERALTSFTSREFRPERQHFGIGNELASELVVLQDVGVHDLRSARWSFLIPVRTTMCTG